MKRLALLLLCALAVLVAAVPSAGAATGAPVSRAVLQNLSCVKAASPVARMVGITAVMRPVVGTRHMQLKFVLLGRPAGSPTFAPIAGTDLGTWLSPTDPTLGQRAGDRFILTRSVGNLGSGAYRFRVSFRWIGAGGTALGTVSQRTTVCHQPELGPDLAITSFTAGPVDSFGSELYTATVANLGGSVASAVEVTFDDGANSVTQPIDALAAHAQTTVQFTGPACSSGTTPTLVLDPGQGTSDGNPANDTLSATCSSSPSGSSSSGS